MDPFCYYVLFPGIGRIIIDIFLNLVSSDKQVRLIAVFILTCPSTSCHSVNIYYLSVCCLMFSSCLSSLPFFFLPFPLSIPFPFLLPFSLSPSTLLPFPFPRSAYPPAGLTQIPVFFSDPHYNQINQPVAHNYHDHNL